MMPWGSTMHTMAMVRTNSFMTQLAGLYHYANGWKQAPIKDKGLQAMVFQKLNMAFPMKRTISTHSLNQGLLNDSEAGSMVYGDYIFIGPLTAATNRRYLRANGITDILSVGEKVGAERVRGITYHEIPELLRLKDNWKLKTSILEGDIIKKAAMIIESVRTKGGRILIHCMKGISRSPAIVMAFLIKYKQRKLLDVYVEIKKRRLIIDPKPNFLLQLMQLEQETLGTSTPVLLQDIENIFNCWR